MSKIIGGTLLAALLAACGPSVKQSSHIKVDQVALGKVVVYRNGVAFYERRAQVRGGKLTVSVPRDRVDDFLKSLTVVDARTQKPLPVAFPRTQTAGGPYIEMTLDVPAASGSPDAVADVLLTYVTESTAWKPSYRLVLGKHGKVMIEGWAIVDNLSGEDWNDVKVGVGSGAAMSFRYDLWSVRTVEREALAADEHFAIAPPTAVSPYGGTAADAAGAGQTVVALDDVEIRRPEGHPLASASVVADAAAVEGGIDILSGKGQPTSTTGVVRGRVIDKGSREPVIGATVVLQGPAIQGQLVAITEEDGSWLIEKVPPGMGTVTIYYNDAQFSRPNVVAAAGKSSVVNVPIDTSVQTAEVIELSGRAPMVDVSSTKSGITVDQEYIRRAPAGIRNFESSLGSSPGSQYDGAGTAFSGNPSPPAPPRPDPIATGDQKLAAIVPELIKQRRHVVVEGYAAPGEPNAEARALDRANVVKNQLIDAGMPPARVRAVAKGAVPGRGAGVQLVTEAPPAEGATRSGAPRLADLGDTPVGESHFMSGVPMDVAKGTSAMVSVLRETTQGEEVYLYDAESERGNDRFAFKAVRLINPTEFTLEAGPVTVYGKDRYIGEGLTEPVPPRAPVVVPFALDRQVVIDREESNGDEVSRLMTLQRGVLTAEVQHLRRTHLTFTSRLHKETKVYVRHTIEKGWTLRDPGVPVERVGDAQLFEVTLPAGATRTLDLVLTTPLTRTLDLAAPATLDLMKVFVESPYPDAALAGQLRDLLAHHRALVDGRDRVLGLRQHLAEYRIRAAELTEQLHDLKRVKSATTLSRHLAARLEEVSDRIQTATIEIVDEQEALMLARVRFQDALSELTLPDLAVAAAAP